MPGQRRVVGDERRSGPGVGTDAFVGDAAVREAEYGRGMVEVVDGDAVAAAAAERGPGRAAGARRGRERGLPVEADRGDARDPPRSASARSRRLEYAGRRVGRVRLDLIPEHGEATGGCYGVGVVGR